MATIQRRPDPSKSEGLLLRIFPEDVLDNIVYFEQAVLANSDTFDSIRYETFVVTRDTLYHLDIHKKHDEPPQGIPFAEIEAVTLMEDLANFFPEAIAMYTSHVRVKSTTTTTNLGLLDFYTFYEDSQLLYQLQQAFRFYKLRRALPQLYLSSTSLSASPFAQVKSAAQIEALVTLSVDAYTACGSGMTPASSNTSEQSIVSGNNTSTNSGRNSGADTGASTGMVVSDVDAPASAQLVEQQHATTASGDRVTYTVSSLPGIDASSGDIHVMDQSPAAVDRRVEYLLAKMRALEQLCLLCGCDKGAVAQKRLLSDTKFTTQFLEDFAIFGAFVQHYLSAETRQVMGVQPSSDRNSIVGAGLASSRSVATTRDLMIDFDANTARKQADGGSAAGLGHTVRVSTARSTVTDPGAGSSRGDDGDGAEFEDVSQVRIATIYVFLVLNAFVSH
jgi:hypothetical protein